MFEFTSFARRVPDTKEVKTRTTNERKLKKGARNGLQETPDRGEVRCEADIRGRLWIKQSRVDGVVQFPKSSMLCRAAKLIVW
jgi:hypothetical protein